MTDTLEPVPPSSGVSVGWSRGTGVAERIEVRHPELKAGPNALARELKPEGLVCGGSDGGLGTRIGQAAWWA